jgi:hypothetical protein
MLVRGLKVGVVKCGGKLLYGLCVKLKLRLAPKKNVTVG